MLTYLVALLGLFWLMNKVAVSPITSGITGSVLKYLKRLREPVGAEKSFGGKARR